MSKENGGPAFPTVDANREEVYGTRGMSLRDYFAAKAMQGFSVNSDFTENTHREIADMAYALADAMLEERSK